MKLFIEETWNEYLALLKKVIPENYQKKIITNKSRYIKIIILVIIIELIGVSIYLIVPQKNIKNQTSESNQAKKGD